MERELPLFENWEHISIAELRAKQRMCCTALRVLAAHAVGEQSGEPGWDGAGTQRATQQLQCPTPLQVYRQLIFCADSALLLSGTFQV